MHGICPSLLGLPISLPVQGAFVLPVWVPLAKLGDEVIKVLRFESSAAVLQLQNIFSRPLLKATFATLRGRDDSAARRRRCRGLIDVVPTQR